MLVSFNSSYNNKKIFLAHNIEIMMNPEHELPDLYWIHHVLEICYYFVPQQSPCPEIFYYLYNCFLIIKLEPFFFEQIWLIKKVYLLKLLGLIGFYPDKQLLNQLLLYEQLTVKSVDFEDKQKVESLKGKLEITKQQIEKIDNWILSCLSSHPCFKLFKTISKTKG